MTHELPVSLATATRASLLHARHVAAAARPTATGGVLDSPR
ncbi:hypothetical protein Cfla_1954 [Cellulomonas flavigena DSM 20109]|uniref:Uncharacterized protein n=1 Tax=Cellulomonas flavigena (strain ATCC 482 / DSM 20109 / BCRC 11376 / JCM 18109 / NBRC 3775 / NCIMB 8073 / NRS 134) TaxID=446466 RepID=D5UF52_CELFN|nr:hypothetical protein [Cellulomonas flavigena]ADG74849.1 hypothetical protein Cfla_1954 [Cellulomonas flavigena DSM 20109]